MGFRRFRISGLRAFGISGFRKKLRCDFGLGHPFSSTRECLAPRRIRVGFWIWSSFRVWGLGFRAEFQGKIETTAATLGSYMVQPEACPATGLENVGARIHFSVQPKVKAAPGGLRPRA